MQISSNYSMNGVSYENRRRRMIHIQNYVMR